MALYRLEDYSLNLINIPSKGQDKTQTIEVLELILDLVNSSGKSTTKKFHIMADTRHTLDTAQDILHDGLSNAKRIKGKIEHSYNKDRIYLWLGLDLTDSKKRESFQFSAHQA